MKKSIITDLVLGEHPITLREYYAGQALPAIIRITALGEQKTWSEVAKITLIAADALIAELEKE